MTVIKRIKMRREDPRHDRRVVHIYQAPGYFYRIKSAFISTLQKHYKFRDRVAYKCAKDRVTVYYKEPYSVLLWFEDYLSDGLDLLGTFDLFDYFNVPLHYERKRKVTSMPGWLLSINQLCYRRGETAS